MKTFTPLLRIGATISLIAGLTVAAGATTAQAEEPTTYRGNAYGVRAYAKVLTLLSSKTVGPVVLANTGALPSSGGVVQADLLKAGTGLSQVDVRADVIDSVVVGTGAETFATSGVAGVTANLGKGTIQIAADVLQAESTARCEGTFGHANIAGLRLVVNGTPISIDPELYRHPNFTKRWGKTGNVTLILNEQYVNAAGNQVTNALHLKIGGNWGPFASADVIIGHAEAGISNACPPDGGGGDGGGGDGGGGDGGGGDGGGGDECIVDDFVTGAGTIVVNGQRISFGVHGGQKHDGSLFGAFNARNRSTGQEWTGDVLTDYDGDGNYRDMEFDQGAQNVRATDNGEPGTVDRIAWAAFDQLLRSGNINLHKQTDCTRP